MIRWLAILALALAPAGARAAPVPPAEQQSLDAFAAANASCREWSDGCVVCMRQGEAADAFACSTPGIACTPSRLACRTPAAAPAAKP